MYWLRRLLLLLPSRRRARLRELDEELASNLSLAVQDAAESGLPDEEAVRTARRDFGSFTRAREESRAVWWPGWDTVSQDVRFALRTLSRAPAFTLVGVLSLALGTGAATALFSLVNTVAIQPLAYRDPGRLVFVREVLPPLAHIYPTLPVNIQHFRFWQEQSRAFASLAAVFPGNVHGTLTTGDTAETVGIAEVSAALFDLLGIQPQHGRGFLPDEDRPGKNRVAVLSDGLWRRRFGAEPRIVGQTIHLDGAGFLVVGILPRSFRFPRKDDLGPLAHLAERTEIFIPLQSTLDGWGGDFDYIVFGRLNPGVTQAQGTTELNLLEDRIVKEHKVTAGLHVQVRPLPDVISSPVRTSLLVLLGAVLVLVLIVCVNLASLLLARGSARAREFSLRVALGASRARLLFSALIETLLLACAGGALGVAAARAALGVFVRSAPVDLPRMDELHVDARVLFFALALSLLCGLLFGLAPALRLSRSDPQTTLRGEALTTSGSRHGLQIREWLVGTEVALSALLLVLAGLLVSSLWHVLRVDRGFTADRALDVAVALPARYRTNQDRTAFLDLAAGRIRSLPGVRSVAVASKVPLTGESNVNEVELDGSHSALDPATRQLIMVNVRFVGQQYFESLGIPLERGRVIDEADRNRNVAVISARLADKLWPGQNPLGKVLSSGSGVGKAEVVGVVGDVHTTRLERDPTLMIYVPYWKSAFQVSHLVVRSSADSQSLPTEVRRTLQAIDSGIPAPVMRTMGEIVAESVAQRRFQMDVAAAFAVSALLLAALGIYGVVAYGMSLRRREFGIRMALGARASAVCRLVLWQGLRPVAIGLAAGIVAALLAGRLVRSMLFGVSSNDGWTLAAVAAGLAVVATLACLVPAWSVSSIDPSRVLRDE